MCGRYALAVSYASLQEQFQLSEHCSFRPRYNIAPSQTILTVLPGRRIGFLPWGLEPSWMPDEGALVSQARIESVAEKRLFQQSFFKKRCLIPASGYFEWKKTGATKQPYYFFMPQESLFAIAGICVNDKVVLLTRPGLLAEGFPRMPVTLLPSMYSQWLRGGGAEDVDWLLGIDHPFVFYPVSPAMNRPALDTAVCISPLS